MTQVFGGKKFERLFREAAGLDMDKSDMKRLYEFVNQKLHDLLIRGVATAQANNREVIEVYDLPITKGLRECIHEVREYETELDLDPILQQLGTLPPLDLAYSYEIESSLTEIVGALTIALAKMFKLVNPKIKNPQSHDWEQVIPIFDVLL